MPTYHLAIDIGASSGRHILGHVEDGKIILEEVYRFPNGAAMQNGHLCWDIEQLFSEILTGMKACKDAGKIPVTLGIDNWAVDFVLLDENHHRIGDAVSYRDSRTEGMRSWVRQHISDEELYHRTGIQYQPFNTIYQLAAIRDDLPKAHSLLMIPDYFHFRLTGNKCFEYTNASSTGLVNAEKRPGTVSSLIFWAIPRHCFRN